MKTILLVVLLIIFKILEIYLCWEAGLTLHKIIILIKERRRLKKEIEKLKNKE